ncbi:YcjF family protein [Roseobacter sinensis]|uniref:YcjF family protein n=1 Tax=Roseobacter sinensis TaxID=2931391 RepID=A0ABT3BH61_9RHOB|nr:YcjF family protein [Roseobacter sp. WL0113]MCV3272917.1 YcjF family protein [Roseobacter sp. WL0113]
MARGPVLIEIDEGEAPKVPVAEAPPVPDDDMPLPQGQAMHAAAGIAAHKPSRLVRWVWSLGLALVGAVVSIKAWGFLSTLVTQNPLLGWAMAGLTAAFLLVLAVVILREVAALGRLGRLDGLRRAADTALADDDLQGARAVTDRLLALYKGREDTRWGRDRLAELRGDQMDAASLLILADRELLGPLDHAAQREVEAAARQVATVTTLVPLALADVAAALAANLRMIRRIAEVYGGRSGFLGGWRLTRAVMAHLVATGAVAVGDDLLEPVLGGSILGKLSRRFGEGLVNGALTARVGVAAMEVCRPLPFASGKKPKIRNIIKQSLGGLFRASKT